MQLDLPREGAAVSVTADTGKQSGVIVIYFVHFVISVLDGERKLEVVLCSLVYEVTVVIVILSVDAGAWVVIACCVKYLRH